MIFIQEIPVSKINEYWDIQFQYLVNDGFITTEEEKKYFQSAEYRDVLQSHMLRTPDTQHMVYFVRDGVKIGASQYCTYKSEDGKCFILDFWVFPEYRGTGQDTNVSKRLWNTQKTTAQCITPWTTQKRIRIDFGHRLVSLTME